LAQVNPQDFRFHIKKGDLNPPLRIQLIDSDTDEAYDLSLYTGTFSMASIDEDDVYKVEEESVNITDTTNGKAEYRWQSGDTDTEGEFIFEFRFTASGKYFTVPVVSPGVVKVERAIGG